MTSIVLDGVALLLILVDIVITMAIVRSTDYGSTQKLLQVIFVWLAPIVGAAMAWYVLCEAQHTGAGRGDGGNENSGWDTPDDHQGHSGHSGHDGGADGGY